MAHPYKREHRSNNVRSVDTIAINAIVTTDDSVFTLSYELSLEDVPEKFHDEIVSIITMSINGIDNDLIEVSKELYKDMGNVFVEEVRDCVKAINNDINGFLSTATEEKEEIKMNATTTTTTDTATQPVENVTPKSETPNPTSMMDRIAAYESHLAKNDVRLDEHQKRLDSIEADVKSLQARPTTTSQDSSLGLGGWTALAVVVGVVGGTGYYFGSR